MRVIDADEALQLCDNDIETMKARIEGKVPFQVGAAMVSAAKELRTNLKEYLDKTPTLDYEPVRHGEWINVNDRLPEEKQSVLVHYVDGWMPIAFLLDGKWYQSGGETSWLSVTHWMALPEPPKEDAP